MQTCAAQNRELAAVRRAVRRGSRRAPSASARARRGAPLAPGRGAGAGPLMSGSGRPTRRQSTADQEGGGRQPPKRPRGPGPAAVDVAEEQQQEQQQEQQSDMICLGHALIISCLQQILAVLTGVHASISAMEAQRTRASLYNPTPQTPASTPSDPQAAQQQAVQQMPTPGMPASWARGVERHNPTAASSSSWQPTQGPWAVFCNLCGTPLVRRAEPLHAGRRSWLPLSSACTDLAARGRQTHMTSVARQACVVRGASALELASVQHGRQAPRRAHTRAGGGGRLAPGARDWPSRGAPGALLEHRGVSSGPAAPCACRASPAAARRQVARPACP